MPTIDGNGVPHRPLGLGGAGQFETRQSSPASVRLPSATIRKFDPIVTETGERLDFEAWLPDDVTFTITNLGEDADEDIKAWLAPDDLDQLIAALKRVRSGESTSIEFYTRTGEGVEVSSVGSSTETTITITDNDEDMRTWMTNDELEQTLGRLTAAKAWFSG